MQSIEDKLIEVYNLSVDLAYDGINPRDTSKYGVEVDSLIWSYIDGLWQKWIVDRINGRCSLRESLEFDLNEVEKKLDRDITTLKNLSQPEED